MIPIPSITIDNGAARNQAPSTAEATVPAPQRDWTNMTRTIAHYERIEQIGEGTYGQVYRARCKDTDQIVALKKIRVHHGGYWGMPPTVIREIKILKRLRHPNLVQMVEVVSSKGVEHLDEDDEVDDKHKNSKNDRIVDAREGFKGNLFLVLEYVSHDLTGLMDVAYRFSEVQVKCIFKQLLEALCYMHENKYIHRDIKSSNILIDHNFRVKLADFGLARSIEPPILDKIQDRGNSLELTNKVITLWYRPPEILLGATRYGTPVDVWSAGCILAELIIGKPLFTGKTEMDQLQLIFDMMGTPTPETWDGFQDLKLLRTGEVTIETARKAKLRDKYQAKVSGAALNLLEKLLELDPQKRLTASRALNSRYFLADPKAPDQPEDLPPLNLEGGHFHEFQTKKKRREAKVVAEKARDVALETGRSLKEAQEEYDEVYRTIMEKVGKEGLNAVANPDERKGDVDGQSKSGERKERKKDRASREKEREVREKEREVRRAERAKEKAERKEKHREDRDKDRANRKRPEPEDGDRPRDRKSDEERRKKRKEEYEARKNDGAIKMEDKSENPRDDIKREQLMDTEPAPKVKEDIDLEKETNKGAVPEEVIARRESPPRSKEHNGVDHGVANPVKSEPKDEVDDRRPIDREERRSSRKRRDRSRDRSHSRDREHTSKERSRERRSSRDPERRSSRDRERRRSRERRRRSRDGERDDRDRRRRSRDPEDVEYPPPDWGRDRDRDMERRGRDRDPDWGRDRDRDWPRDRRTPPEKLPPPRDMDHYGPSRGDHPPSRGGPPSDFRGRRPPSDGRRGPPPGDFGMYGPASGDVRPSGGPPPNHYGESRHRDHPDVDRRRERSPPRRGRGRDRR